MSFKVFISHSSQDKNKALKVYQLLKTNNIKCWISYFNISPGQSWVQAILEGIQICPIFILLISPHSNESNIVEHELRTAINNEKRILPIRIAEVNLREEFAFFIGHIHRLDIFLGSFEDHNETILNSVVQFLDPNHPYTVVPTQNLSQYPAPQLEEDHSRMQGQINHAIRTLFGGLSEDSRQELVLQIQQLINSDELVQNIHNNQIVNLDPLLLQENLQEDDITITENILMNQEAWHDLSNEGITYEVLSELRKVLLSFSIIIQRNNINLDINTLWYYKLKTPQVNIKNQSNKRIIQFFLPAYGLWVKLFKTGTFDNTLKDALHELGWDEEYKFKFKINEAENHHNVLNQSFQLLIDHYFTNL